MRRPLLISVIVLAALTAPATAWAVGPGQVSGTVRPLSIAPEVEVCVVETRPSELCAAPGADGNYSLTGIPLGQVRIEFLPSYRSRYVPQYYLHARTLAEAATISLSSFAPTRTRIDAELEHGGEIEGSVTAEEGGAPLGGIEVCALGAGTGAPAGCVDTDEAGGYELGALPPGAYKVGFWGRGASAEYAPQYYDQKATLAAATTLSVVAGGTRAGVDAEIVKGAQVRGTVSAAAGGTALPDVPVCLFPAAATGPSQCVYTDPDGTYSLIGISSGSYQVGFSLGSAEIGGEAVSSEDDGYLTQYYAYVPSRSEARTLTLSGEQVAGGIDAQLVTPSLGPPPLPTPPVASNVMAAPALIAEPVKPTPLRCKKGFEKKKVKGAEKCVQKKPAKKHRKSKRHGKRGKKPGNKHQRAKGKS